MIKILWIIALICVSIYFFDKVCLWLENQGWLYYRNKKPEPGIAGKALLEFHSFLNPGARHVIEVKQGAHKQKQNENNFPGELKN